MRHRIILIAFALLSVTVFSGCNGDTYISNDDTMLGYDIYKNHKYGYTFSYPLFLKTMKFGFDSDKKTFTSKDGRISAIATARFNHSGRTMKSLLNEERYFLQRDGYRITYEFSKNGIVVFSGYTPDNKIFYNKIAICDLYSPEFRSIRSVIARVDVVFEDGDRYRGEEITELLKKFPYEKRN